MHLERTVGTAARFADAGVQAADRVVPTARDRGAHVDGIDSGPLPAHWLWLLDRADSPRYPALRLFRPRVEGDWDYVFDTASAALTALTGI